MNKVEITVKVDNKECVNHLFSVKDMSIVSEIDKDIRYTTTKYGIKNEEILSEMVKQEKFYKFVEFNEHEGETWTFYIKLERDLADRIYNLIKDSEEYILDLESILETDVDIIISNTSHLTGYLNAFNKSIPNFTMKDLEFLENNQNKECAVYEFFYKGDCWKSIK